MFDLGVEGVTRLRRLAPFSEKSIAWEPLAGLVDGTNTYFRVRRDPVKASSLTVYESGGSTPYTFTQPDLVTMTSAPTAQPYGNYVHQPLTDRQAKQLLMDGIMELEMRWARGLRLSSSTSSYVVATEDDTNIYVVGADTLTDPSDTVNLSDREAQKGIIVQCAYYVYRFAELLIAARTAVSVRGTAGGMTLDRKAIPQFLIMSLQKLDERIATQIHAAMVEWTGGASLGGVFKEPHSRDYWDNYEWQSASILHNWEVSHRYQPSDVDVLAIS